MFVRQPAYTPNIFYDPYSYPSYQQPSIPARDRRFLADEESMQERARVLAQQRARRAQYLPDEDNNSEDEWEYNQLGPRQHAYLEAKRRQALLERRQEEERLARQRILEEQKWHEALERKQREDEEYRRKLLDERKREARLKREQDARQEQSEKETTSQTTHRPPVAPHEDTSVPIFIVPQQETPSSLPSVATEPEGQSKGAHTLEEMNDAASRIQREYRIHLASRTLDDILSQFKTLQKGFAYPRVIDFKKPGGDRGHITVPANRPPSDFADEALSEADECEGKLDYTSTNYPLHAYSDALDKLLMKLDEVESRGEKSIREKRRGIVKDIEKEVSRLDWYWKQAWTDYNKAQEMGVDIQEDHNKAQEVGMDIEEDHN